ncbi:Xaa-Pro peptidase family protein [Alsobacter sp. KACC 23698]|uniref:Xaa-Pro peptidase family protein n=1 Tax=Alsobacter sp. KACC 23698 TaxID=3149229 RepID=A0AAU7JB67_9HYPH
MIQTSPAPDLPFSFAALDDRLEQAGVDILISSSRHNLAYLLGGHRHHFFEAAEAIGVSRYLPLLVYPKGRPDEAAYIAFRNEKDSLQNRALEGRALWPATVRPAASGVADAVALAIDHIRAIGGPGGRIGVETHFLPWLAGQALRDAFPAHGLVDANRPLERLRAVKSDAELDRLREASERVVAAMQAVMRSTRPGTSKRAIERALRREEEARGLLFDYALITLGTSLNRAPSDQVCRDGDIMSLDSGGNLDGYIGDLCRMAVFGEADAELEDLLGEVRTVQDAARKPLAPGVRGGDVFSFAQAALAALPSAASTTFVAHGMGLVSHEAPRLTAQGPISYPADDADLPLEAGMILSIETTLQHPRRGFIKIEDTVAITPDGHVGFGDEGRGWTRAGLEAPPRQAGP